MLKTLITWVLLAIAAVVGLAAVGLAWAHLSIRRERAPLPTPENIIASRAGDDRPVRLSYINTASQAMPRAAVLAPQGDPRAAQPYVMSHPSFVLEWADGRMLLIDTGMTRHGALAFGRLTEWLGGAAPIDALTSVAARLGEARQRVLGVIFTHLHTDHTGGIGELCAGMRHPVRVLMIPPQAERLTLMTRPGLQQIEEAGCVTEERLADPPLMAAPGFPGVFVIDAGGHTPGSQIIIAHVGAPESRTYAFAGDIANNIDGITYDIPKPFLYRLLFVPEDDARLSELRNFLRRLRDQYGVTVLVSHDQHAIEGSGIVPWGGERHD